MVFVLCWRGGEDGQARFQLQADGGEVGDGLVAAEMIASALDGLGLGRGRRAYVLPCEGAAVEQEL